MNTKLAQGTRGTYAGFPAVIVRHYAGRMYEIRTTGGLAVVDLADFVVSRDAANIAHAAGGAA